MVDVPQGFKIVGPETVPQGFKAVPPEPEQPEAIGAPLQLAQGFNVALAQTLGLPVDAVNAAFKKIGLGSEQPFGGSESIKSGLESIGVGVSPPDPQGLGERLAASAGRALGATAVPAGALLKAGQLARPAATGFAALAQQAPTGVALAEAGAAIGGGIGEQIAREVAPESQIAPVIGALAGGLGPSLITQTAKSLAQGGARGAENISETIERFSRLGIDETPSLALANQQRSAQVIESTINRLPFGGRISESATRVSDSLGKKIDDLVGTRELSATRAGSVIDNGLFGEAGFVKRFQSSAEKNYKRLDELVPAGTPSPAANTKAAFADLAEVVPGAEATSIGLQSPFIRDLSSNFAIDIEKGFIPYNALQKLRTQIGRKLSGGDIIADAPKAELKRLYAGLSEDLRDTATEIGPEARSAFERANSFYNAGLNRIETQFKNLSKKAGQPEDIFRSATSGTAEGASRLNAIRKSITPTEWKTVSNTIIKRLGRATPGRQDELGEVFSSETFLTNFNKLSREAKDAVFARRPEFRRDLEDISRIAADLRTSGRVSANPSGTAAAAIEAGAGPALLTLSVVDPASAAVLVSSLTANNITSRLLTSERFVKFLATAARLPAERLPAQIARLAAQEPENADEAIAVEEFLNIIGKTP